MRSFGLEAKVGVFFLVCLAIFLFSWFRVLKWDTEQGFTLKAEFRSVEGLAEGAQVQIAGIKVGTVKTIKLDRQSGKALVIMEIKDDYKNSIPEDSRVMIRTKGLLGDKYVIIEPGKPNARKVKPGEELELVYEPPAAEKVLETLGFVTQDLKQLTREARKQLVDEKGGKKLQRIVSNIDDISSDVKDLIGGNKEKINSTITNLDESTLDLKQILARNKDKVNETLDRVNSASQSFNKTGDKFRELAEDLQDLADDVKRGRGTLGKLVSDDRLYRQASALVADLRNVSNRIQYGGGAVSRLINDPELYYETRRAIRNMNKTAEDVSEATPVSTLAIILGSVFR